MVTLQGSCFNIARVFVCVFVCADMKGGSSSRWLLSVSTNWSPISAMLDLRRLQFLPKTIVQAISSLLDEAQEVSKANLALGLDNISSNIRPFSFRLLSGSFLNSIRTISSLSRRTALRGPILVNTLFTSSSLLAKCILD